MSFPSPVPVAAFTAHELAQLLAAAVVLHTHNLRARDILTAEQALLDRVQRRKHTDDARSLNAHQNLARPRLAAALFGTTPEDLAEPVLDAAGDTAVLAYHAGALSDLTGQAAHSALHDQAEQRAHQINQAGLDAQLVYLLEADDYDTVLNPLSPTFHGFVAVVELSRHQRRSLPFARVRQVDQHTLDVRITLADDQYDGND